MPKMSPARDAAFSILLSAERGRSHADDLLRGKSVNALSAADRNLTTALVLGTLRWQIELDAHIRPLLKHPNAKLDPQVLIALRLGAFQLMHLERIPAHAAIDASVELTKRAGHRFASGMVNAVLRKIAQAAATLRHDGLPIEPDHVQAYPAWMVERWTRNYGTQAAHAICVHGQNPPTTTVRLADAAAEAELSEDGIRMGPSELLTLSRNVASGEVSATHAFSEGRVRTQDEGSQLIAELVPRGSAILDCCAAPGGKTLILAERNRDARIVAGESNAQRMAQLRKRLQLLEGRIEFRTGDATQLADESAFDVVLADVPCSGTGTLGRNPEIRHRMQLNDLPRQAERQKAILRAALRAVRHGGHVVYSTCSLEPEENEEVVAAVLGEVHEARQVSIASRIEELRAENILTPSGTDRLLSCVTDEGYLRLLPSVFRSDGFFAAILQRTG
jgi:16S rRNA (cytosine967-C5)-methyltransferase